MSARLPDIETIKRYFPELDAEQYERFAALEPLYREWNERINVISRKDIDSLYEHHVLHSLAIAKTTRFAPTARVLDVGTGGGFPGVPLAILFPDVHFHLIDSIGKKLKIVESVTAALRLHNVTFQHIRAEDLNDRYRYVVSRAVAAVPQLMQWLKGKLCKDANIFLLKGGNLNEELTTYSEQSSIYPISDFFSESYFDGKKVVKIEV